MINTILTNLGFEIYECDCGCNEGSACKLINNRYMTYFIWNLGGDKISVNRDIGPACYPAIDTIDIKDPESIQKIKRCIQELDTLYSNLPPPKNRTK